MPKMPPNSQEEIRNRFEYHKPGTTDIAADHESVRDECYALTLLVLKLVPPSREQSLAITKIEEAMMWANAGIARNQ